MLYVKGAPEVLLPRCRDVDAGADQPSSTGLAAAGQRVLAVRRARRSAGGRARRCVVDDLRLLGLAGLIDPPREEAVEAVDACTRAGIAVKMITGDHPRTARPSARALGISGARR